jgi:hypothetical protein
MMHKILVIILILSGLTLAQTSNQQDTWKPFRFFVGSWEGTGKGQHGESKLEREYKFILNGKYLQFNHKSTYPPQVKNPKGEVHEDLGLMSYDRNRKQFILRQFHIEGFVNGYALTSISEDGKTIIFTTIPSPKGLTRLTGIFSNFGV